MFPNGNGKTPFCNGNRLQPLPIKNGGDDDLFPGVFYLTNQETVDHYWMVVFILSMIVFLALLAYLVAALGLVILYAGTAIFLRRKASLILDESDFGGRNLSLEMLEANTLVVTPDVERRVNEGFKTWMG